MRVGWLCLIGVLPGALLAAPGPTTPGALETQPFDIAVVQATPGGIAMAVRAAREGLRVLLVNHNHHLGGILSSGLGVWDTQFEGRRSPIYDEVRQAFFDHYRATYGEDSPQYRDALPGKTGYTNGRFEPRVAERILADMVSRESGITVLKGFHPVETQREGPLIQSVTFRETAGTQTVQVAAKIFADCTYEGDLLPLAKARYRIGRESREEFGEPHAGIIFMRPSSEPPSAEAARMAERHDALNLRKFAGFQAVLAESTGSADGAVQACNYRTMLCTDPENRVPISKPKNYDAYFLKSLEIFSGVESVPNDKFSWNRPQLVARQTAYIEAEWPARQRIADEHWDATMGLLYFLQNDLSVPGIVRRAWREYGLARDEFPDNGNRPYEMYIREGRRLVGRAVFTEHDATLARGLGRAPVQMDSVAMTEWYMDSHSCTTARVPGGLEEGKMMLHHETFPGQIPYRCLLVDGLDNLLVPVCLSATHVAWGTVRLEPVWMQVGESAGLAAALAMKDKTTPAKLDPDRLLRRLCELRSMITFFNDVDVASGAAWVPAVQYFGTKGFFHDYDARADDGLKRTTAMAWAEGLGKLLRGDLDPNALAKTVARAEGAGGEDVTAADFAAMLPQAPKGLAPEPGAIVPRGVAMEVLYSLLPGK